MKSSVKKLIIFLAIIFLLFIYAGLGTYNSHKKDQVISSEDQKNISEEKGEDKKNFEIEDLSHEEKKQIEESLGYEISEIKHIKLLDKDDYTEEEVKNREGYTIENISEVKDAIEFSGPDVYESICDNKNNEEAEIKIGERILRNDYMADLPMDPKIISNALDFDVRKENKIDLDLGIKVEGKTFATASLYPEINSYDFKILNKDGEVRKGSAKKVVGVYLIVRKEQINEI